MNTGTYSVFATVFGMKMYYFFVESKHRRRRGSGVPAGEYYAAFQSPKTIPPIPSPESSELIVSDKSSPFIISPSSFSQGALVGRRSSHGHR
jgi:hypothetical protein